MIPTITLTNDPTEDEIRSLRNACENVGFFYLQVGFSGKGEEDLKQLQSQVLSQSKAFFTLPFDVKKQISDSKLNRGYTGFEEEILDPKKQSKGDTKEGFYIADDISKDDSRYNPDKLCGPNVWPDEIDSKTNDFDPKRFKKVMMTYHNRMKEIGFTVVQMLALSLNLPKQYFDSYFDTNPMAFLRLLHYSAERSKIEEGIYACGAHSDYGMITILATDENPGLQIKSNDTTASRSNEECWVDVAPPPLGTFVVNLGDMLERWTNGRYKSTVHRVISKTGRERFSMPFFYEPAFDTVVTCLQSCKGDDGIVKYPPTTSGQHLLSKYKETHTDFEYK